MVILRWLVLNMIYGYIYKSHQDLCVCLCLFSLQHWWTVCLPLLSIMAYCIVRRKLDMHHRLQENGLAQLIDHSHFTCWKMVSELAWSAGFGYHLYLAQFQIFFWWLTDFQVMSDIFTPSGPQTTTKKSCGLRWHLLVRLSLSGRMDVCHKVFLGFLSWTAC